MKEKNLQAQINYQTEKNVSDKPTKNQPRPSRTKMFLSQPKNKGKLERETAKPTHPLREL